MVGWKALEYDIIASEDEGHLLEKRMPPWGADRAGNGLPPRTGTLIQLRLATVTGTWGKKSYIRLYGVASYP